MQFSNIFFLFEARLFTKYFAKSLYSLMDGALIISICPMFIFLLELLKVYVYLETKLCIVYGSIVLCFLEIHILKPSFL